MMNKLDLHLQNFFIFNTAYGTKEGEEHEKILFYYPSSETGDNKIKNVGLVEAILQFTKTFKPSKPVHSVHMQKKRQLYYQPEEKYWMIMTINVPQMVKAKDNGESVDYLEEDVQDNVFESVLMLSYRLYKLFNGTFEDECNSNSLNGLKEKIDRFFTEHLQTLKLPSCDILNVFNGMQFLPLDKETFINVQCFVNQLECGHPAVRCTAFLYNEHLVWSGLEPQDMQLVYYHLIRKLIPEEVKLELMTGSMMSRNSNFSSTNPSSLYQGRFITGPTNLKGKETKGTEEEMEEQHRLVVDKVPKIYVTYDGRPTCFYMIVYRTLSSSVCMFVDAKETQLTLQLFRDLNDFIAPNLIPVVSDIAEYCARQPASPTTANATVSNPNDPNSPKFVYFNQLNLAYKSTVHLDNKQNGNVACNGDLIRIMIDMNGNKHDNRTRSVGETIVKTSNDYWVVGKRSNFREFYVVLQQKNASLIEVSDEIAKLSENELKGIFFYNI